MYYVIDVDFTDVGVDSTDMVCKVLMFRALRQRETWKSLTNGLYARNVGLRGVSYRQYANLFIFLFTKNL